MEPLDVLPRLSQNPSQGKSRGRGRVEPERGEHQHPQPGHRRVNSRISLRINLSWRGDPSLSEPLQIPFGMGM